MTVSIDTLPAAAADASVRLRDELLTVLGDDLKALWLHGGTTFPDRPVRPGDLDICGVIASVRPSERVPRVWRRDPASRRSRVQAGEIAVSNELGVVFDTKYLLIGEVGADKPPSEAFRGNHREPSWPVFRAHWLARQYVLLHGSRPEELVIAPSPAALRVALDREIEHLERHVREGDADDPAEATYAILNGWRILYTLDTGSPVVSKRRAGEWGLEHLQPRWHDSIRAAQRAYDGVAGGADAHVLRNTMAAFIETVRQRLPAASRRRKAAPRWS